MVRKGEPGAKTKMHLVAQHQSGAVKLYRREDDGKLVRVTTYPKDGPAGRRGTLYVAVSEDFMASVRAWATWEVFEEVHHGPQSPLA